MNGRRETRGSGDRQADANATARARRSSQHRLARTIILGSLAVAAAIIWLADEFGMDTDVLLDYAVTSVLFVLGAVVLALAGAVLLRLAKKLLGR